MQAGGPTQRPATDGFRPDIEGLRAVAVLLVVLYHAVPAACPGGFVGVDVFFVISGFLITRLLLRELAENGRISFVGFYARRAKRILPAAGLVALATLAASAVLLTPLAAQRVVTDVFSSSGFWMNYRLAVEGSDYLTASLPPSPLQHYWSLSVEEQFYLVWPLLLSAAAVIGVRIGRGRRSRRIEDRGQRSGSSFALVCVLGAVVATSLALSIWLTPSSPDWAYYSLWTRAFELGIGALAGTLVARRRVVLPAKLAVTLGFCGLAAIAVSAAKFSGSTPFPGDAALVPVLGATAVIAAGSTTAAGRVSAGWILGLAPFRWLGARSYSWYLWHFPLLVLVPVALGHALSRPAALALAGASLVVAAAAYRLVEDPVRRSTRLAARPRLSVIAGLATIALVIGTAAAVARALPSLTPTGPSIQIALRSASETGAGALAQVQADLARSLTSGAVPSNLEPPLDSLSAATSVIYDDGCHLGYLATVNPPCIFGDTSSQTTVVLFGDSHAAQWFPALDGASLAEHWKLVSLTKSGCSPVDVVVYRSGGTPFPQCAVWRQLTEDRIMRMHPTLVLVSWDRQSLDQASVGPGVRKGFGGAWADAVAATLGALRASGAVVVLIEDTPRLGADVPDCVSGHLGDVYACSRSRAAAIDRRERRVEARVAALEGVRVIDPTSWFCTSTRCPAVVGNLLVYRDDQHVTAQYSRFLAPVLAEALDPMVPRPS